MDLVRRAGDARRNFPPCQRGKGALWSPIVSESIQSVPAFGKKAKPKTSGGGLLALGYFAILLVLAAIFLVFSNVI